jgi:DnaJ-class molecular chaperone
MENKQAKAMADKVWGSEGWVSFRSYPFRSQAYSVCAGGTGNIYNGDSYESAFLAAGVKVCEGCDGIGEWYPAGHAQHEKCSACNGLGYTLTEVKG